jgi:hypothetical protein
MRNSQLPGLDKRLEHDIKKLNFFKRIEKSLPFLSVAYLSSGKIMESRPSIFGL